MKLIAKSDMINGKVLLTVGETKLALSKESAEKLAEQLYRSANPTWNDYYRQLGSLMDDLYKKPGEQ